MTFSTLLLHLKHDYLLLNKIVFCFYILYDVNKISYPFVLSYLLLLLEINTFLFGSDIWLQTVQEENNKFEQETTCYPQTIVNVYI